MAWRLWACKASNYIKEQMGQNDLHVKIHPHPNNVDTKDIGNEYR